MPSRRGDIGNSFGRIAVAQGWATAAQVEESVGVIEKLAKLGFREKLGAVMVKKGYLKPEQVQEILLIQGKRSAHRIEGYEILSKLGQGGMGSVYKARQISLDREVAVKILSPELAQDHVYVERFLREARAVAQLNHPNIIQGIDVGESNSEYYFAMEFVDGPTLLEILRSEGPMSEDRVLLIAEGVAKALGHAHKNGFVHRDVKPDNIMIAHGRDAKLCDLGLAKSIARTGDSGLTTHDGPVAVGTPHYISPEQALGKTDVDIRTDIYSLGATLFHALTGRTPYEADDPVTVMTKHVNDVVPDARAVNPSVSEDTARLVSKMMAKKPEDRHRDPAALLKDIRALRLARTRSGQKAPAARGGAKRPSRHALRAEKAPAAAPRPHAPAQPAAPRVHAPAPSPRPTTDIGARRVAARRVLTRRVFTSANSPYVAAVGAGILLVGVVIVLTNLGGASPTTGLARPSTPRTTAAGAPEETLPGEAPAGVPTGDSADVLLDRAVKFAAQNPDRFREIMEHFEGVEKAGEGTPYAEAARQEIERHRRRMQKFLQVHLTQCRLRTRELLAEGNFSEAYRLWADLPANLVPESEEERTSILKTERRVVTEAAAERLARLLDEAYAKVERGDQEGARRTIAEAMKIDLEGFAQMARDAASQIERAIGADGTEERRALDEASRARCEEVLRLAGQSAFASAASAASAALGGRVLPPWRQKLELMAHDMTRLVARQDAAMEGIKAKAGSDERVSLHKGTTSYSARVVKVEGDAITLRPMMSGGDVVIGRQELSADDIRGFAPILLSTAAGSYDFAILLLYAGRPEKAMPYFRRCLTSEELGAPARQHIAEIGGEGGT